ncbi:MAG: hypothetical protein VB031_05530 [Eubacteriaceae bacterium]|nr:hypothetical protein [Eubacteriaceae bacterium]
MQADDNRDKKVSLEEIYKYSCKAVYHISGYQQVQRYPSEDNIAIFAK